MANILEFKKPTFKQKAEPRKYICKRCEEIQVREAHVQKTLDEIKTEDDKKRASIIFATNKEIINHLKFQHKCECDSGK